ncbi:hypothetical protein BRADI_2g50895v3 [Brachypodium distachyon]|uniref:Uncharacterized protein n=1 Tax=Brachypodium distachyon TaxID=15368 RepID=A0A2K2DF63_BRADI|nr:hypothetical protein BRADI_2g50895v3 [Brachypodium distachyon]
MGKVEKSGSQQSSLAKLYIAADLDLLDPVLASDLGSPQIALALIFPSDPSSPPFLLGKTTSRSNRSGFLTILQPWLLPVVLRAVPTALRAVGGDASRGGRRCFERVQQEETRRRCSVWWPPMLLAGCCNRRN